MSSIFKSVSPRRMPEFPEFVTIMACLMAMTALSIDIMLPALPLIATDFTLSGANDQQLVVTSYVLGFAIGQLFQGPLSDRYGRRPVLLTGLAIYALAAFGCLIAGSFETLLGARFIQGLANAAPRIIAIAVVRDIYGGRRMAEVMSFVMMVFIIVPIIAPSIGGAFMIFGSWHLIFAFLCVCALGVLTWVALRLPETHPAEAREPMSPRWLVAAFTEALTTRQTLGYTLVVSMLFGSLMGYINSAQQIFLEVYGVGALFPLYFGCVAGALAIAAFISGRFVMRLGMRRLAHAAVLGFMLCGMAHLGIYLAFGPPRLPLFLLLLGGTLFCFGLSMPNCNSLAMEPMGRIAGTASSFIGAVTTGLGAVIGWVIGQSFDGTPGPLLAGFAGLGLVALCAVLVTESGRLFGTGAPDARADSA